MSKKFDMFLLDQTTAKDIRLQEIAKKETKYRKRLTDFIEDEFDESYQMFNEDEELDSEALKYMKK